MQVTLVIVLGWVVAITTCSDVPVCKVNGEFLLHPTNRCKFLCCTYGPEPWDNNGNFRLSPVEMECPLGTAVGRAFYSQNSYGFIEPKLVQHSLCSDRVSYSALGHFQGYGFDPCAVDQLHTYGYGYTQYANQGPFPNSAAYPAAGKLGTIRAAQQGGAKSPTSNNGAAQQGVAQHQQGAANHLTPPKGAASPGSNQRSTLQYRDPRYRAAQYPVSQYGPAEQAAAQYGAAQRAAAHYGHIHYDAYHNGAHYGAGYNGAIHRGLSHVKTESKLANNGYVDSGYGYKVFVNQQGGNGYPSRRI